MKAPLCRICDAGVFPSFIGDYMDPEEFFFSFFRRKDSGGNTGPFPLSKYFEKLKQYSLRDDFHPIERLYFI